MIDFGSRIGNIRSSYNEGGNWEREMFIESSSFAVSAATGSAVVSGGGALLGLLVVATPIGWAGLIIGGVIVAGTAAVASVSVNNIVKEDAGSVYDSITKWLGRL